VRLLALDFDGVISDSAPEAFSVALRTYLELLPDSQLAGVAQSMLGAKAPSPESVAGHPLYPGFLELMPLGNRAEDYGVILGALELRRDVPDQAAYDVLHAGTERSWLRRYHKSFYKIRAGLAARDAEGWERLMGPYPELLEILRRRSGDAVLAIATAKDRRSVEKLLQIYGIADLIPLERVHDKETGVTKDAHLEHLGRQFGLAPEEMTFIDDKVNHLDVVAKLGVRCGLAAWGYNGTREAALARQRGHLVCSLADVEEQLFAAESGPNPSVPSG